MRKHYETFDQLQKAVRKFVQARDWDRFHNPKNLTMAIAVEASELMGLLQWFDNKTASTRSKEKKLIDKLSEELADVVIYCASLANVLGLKLGTITAKKLSGNSAKYSIAKAKRIAGKLREGR